MKTNKEKMIALMKACLNDKRFYNKFFQSPKDEDVSINSSAYWSPIQTSYTYVTDEGEYYISTGDKEKFTLPNDEHSSSVEEYLHSISVVFSNSPPLKLQMFNKDTKEVVREFNFIETLKKPEGFFAMFKPNPTIDRKFKLMKRHIESFYVLSHGTLRENLTLAEGLELTLLFKNKQEEVKKTIDLEKLDKRIEKYVK